MAEKVEAEIQEKKPKKEGKEPHRPEPKKLATGGKIIRIVDTNLDGGMKVGRALARIKGISFMLSNAICKAAGINPSAKLETLSEDSLKKLEEEIKNPHVPSWLLNRRKDIKTGKDIHLSGSDIDIVLREDISLMKKIRCYKGIRHEMGQPVRGQRTRSTFRKNKSVGVMRKKAAPAKAAQPKQ